MVLDHQAYPLRVPVLTGEAAQAVIEVLVTDDHGDGVGDGREKSIGNPP